MDKYMDYFQNLPASMQFILALITVLGTSGFLTGMFSVWKIYATSSEQNQRIKMLELDKIRIEAEGRQAEAMNANMKNLIEVISAGNERWQKVLDVKSERQLEADRLQHETNKMFIEAVERNTKTVANISEMLEIQSEHLGGFGRVMQHFENKLDTTLQTVESTTRDNRTDLTTALGMNVNQRNENENTLRSIIQAVDSLRLDVKQTISTGEDQRNQTLSAIDNKLASIERRLTEVIAPRPVLLGVAEETPIEEISTELITESKKE